MRETMFPTMQSISISSQISATVFNFFLKKNIFYTNQMNFYKYNVI